MTTEFILFWLNYPLWDNKALRKKMFKVWLYCHYQHLSQVELRIKNRIK